jgi:hypothetical protein
MRLWYDLQATNDLLCLWNDLLHLCIYGMTCMQQMTCCVYGMTCRQQTAQEARCCSSILIGAFAWIQFILHRLWYDLQATNGTGSTML